jgi:phosphate transport system permease protein
MTDITQISRLSSDALPGVRIRHRREKRFRRMGLGAIAVSLGFLGYFLVAIFSSGYGAFLETVVKIDVQLDEETLGIEASRPRQDLVRANYRGVLRNAMTSAFPDAIGRSDRRELAGLLGAGAEYELRDLVMNNPALIGTRIEIWTATSDDVHLFRRCGGVEDTDQFTKLTEKQIGGYKSLDQNGDLRTRFSWTFLSNSDSRDPELAGVWGAIKGSFFALSVCLLLSFAVGALAAIYLEEFAPKNRWMQVLEVNINNLAAVPSITYGLLGLAIFLGFFGLPRSASLVGGMVLSLMTLPTIVISSRVALQAVPPSIREAAFGVGASHIQTVFHHVAPLALPGMLTGTIIGMARALGETAPLLMIGMVAFIVDPPSGYLDPASALPVQVYLWADSPERAFAEKTAGAIIVLLTFLVIMNLAAVILRRRFEKKW